MKRKRSEPCIPAPDSLTSSLSSSDGSGFDISCHSDAINSLLWRPRRHDKARSMRGFTEPLVESVRVSVDETLVLTEPRARIIPAVEPARASVTHHVSSVYRPRSIPPVVSIRQETPFSDLETVGHPEESNDNGLFPRLSNYTMPFSSLPFPSSNATLPPSLSSESQSSKPLSFIEEANNLGAFLHGFALPSLNSTSLEVVPPSDIIPNSADLTSEVSNIVVRGKRERGSKLPRRPASAFVHFSREQRGVLRASHSHLSFDEITRILAAQWHGMNPMQRAPFEELRLMDTRRYFSEKESIRLSAPARVNEELGLDPES